MSQADAYSTPGRFPYHVFGSRNLRRNGHYADMPSGSLPQAVEQLHRRILYVLRRMRSSLLLAYKWAFQMNSKRTCPMLPGFVPRGIFNIIRKTFQSAERRVQM